MELESKMLSEISQLEKDIYHMFSLICGIYETKPMSKGKGNKNNIKTERDTNHKRLFYVYLFLFIFIFFSIYEIYCQIGFHTTPSAHPKGALLNTHHPPSPPSHPLSSLSLSLYLGVSYGLPPSLSLSYFSFPFPMFVCFVS